jgi:hypothetical protein
MDRHKLKEYIRKKHPYFFYFLKKIKEIVFGFYRKSYSQFGEDMVLSTDYRLVSVANITFIFKHEVVV